MTKGDRKHENISERINVIHSTKITILDFVATGTSVFHKTNILFKNDIHGFNASQYNMDAIMFPTI